MKRVPLIGLVGGAVFIALLAFLFWIGSASGPHRVSYSAFENKAAEDRDQRRPRKTYRAAGRF
jgi:hypothetical protein